jgi:uncharacterized protein
LKRASIDLLDVNVWVALTASEHSHRSAAMAYWDRDAAPLLAFTTITALGLLRLTCSNSAMRGVAFTTREAWDAYLTWRRRSDVLFLPEPPRAAVILGRWVSEGRVSPAGWNDAYLAACAVSAGARLVTFDKGIGSLPALHVLTL